jgi:spermidine synthase
MRHALLFSVFVIASCGLAYELIAGALASYLLGDSVMQFSTVIGTYLFAMGAGSWLSKYITRDLVGRFIQIELMVGLLGGFRRSACFSSSPGWRRRSSWCSICWCSASACWSAWKFRWSCAS